MEIELNEKNFEEEVIKSDVPVLCDFWATWCGPCQMIAPIIEEIAAEYDGKIKVGKINVDECPGLAVSFGVESIPTLIYVKDGKVVSKKVGYMKKEEIEKIFAE